MKPLSFILALATLCSCVSHSQPVYLGQLKSSAVDSQDAQAYGTLQKAVVLANDFLDKAPFVKGYPAEKAYFDWGVNDIILRLGNELAPRYDLVITLEEDWLPAQPTPPHWQSATQHSPSALPYWLAVTPSSLSALPATKYPSHWPQTVSDNTFIPLPEVRMAAALLSESVVMRKIQASGEIDDWLNYILLDTGTNSGWGDNRAALTEQAFYQWHAGL